MVEQAFDDQCTGANPRYPLMSEIKQMYLNALLWQTRIKEEDIMKFDNPIAVRATKTVYRDGDLAIKLF